MVPPHGEFEEGSWYDRLESIQTDDYDPFLDRHYELLIKSEFDGKFEVDVTWNPLKSPTPKEIAEINQLNSVTDQNLAGQGAIDGVEIRDRLIADERSGYSGMEPYKDEGDVKTDDGGDDGEQEEES